MDELHSMVTQPSGNASPVPGAFAEKAMASLMQLHNQLMEEKERRVDLYRRLMEREQTVAELRMYVKLLEDKLNAASGPPAPRLPVAAVKPVESAPRLAIAPPSRPPARKQASLTARAVHNWRAW
jgi:hypothetical protein